MLLFDYANYPYYSLSFNKIRGLTFNKSSILHKIKLSHSNFYLPHLIGFIYYGKVISFLLRNKIYLQKYNLTVFLRHLSSSYLEFYLKQKYAIHKITNPIPHFPNPLIPKLSTNLQKYLDTNVSTSPHVRVKTSARTCQDLVTYVSR